MLNTEQIKKVTKNYCGNCNEELKNIPAGFDSFSFLNPITQRYCNNNKCSRYGVVTVASIPKEILDTAKSESEGKEK